MAYRVEGEAIYMTRGDTLIAEVSVMQDATTPYEPTTGDVLTFALKHSRMKTGNRDFADERPLITKTIPNNTLLLRLDPQDTKSLDFGDYKYEISMTFANGQVDTFIDDAPFIITPEVY